MIRSARAGLIGFFEIALVVIFVLAAAEASAAFKYTSVGMDAHNFSGKDIVSGNSVSLQDLNRDKLVIVVFWATWSPRSLEQLRDLNELKTEYVGQPIEIVAVNVDGQKISPALRANIDRTIKELDLQFPVIIDEGLEIFYTYGVIAVPSSAVIDTGGVVRYDPSGYGMIVQDVLTDSIKVFLGLAEPKEDNILTQGYEPEKKAARYYNLALRLNQTGMSERALENLELAHQADGAFPAPLCLKGEILRGQGKLEESKQAFSLAARVDSNMTVIWAGWGRTLLWNHQLDEAREKLTMALSLDGTYTPALIDFGLCLARQDSTEKAIESLLEAVELNQGDPMIHYYLGQVYRQAGQEGEAALSFLRALSVIYPEN